MVSYCNPITLVMLLLQLSITIPLSKTTTLSSNLDEPILVDPDHQPHTEIKCGSCPCVNPCAQLQPPPPPSPPPKNPITTQYCPPPPPPPRFIYVTSVPGNLYQTDPENRWWFYSGAGPKDVVRLLLLLAYGMLALVVFC